MKFKTIGLAAAFFLCSQFLFSRSVNPATHRRSADPASYRVVVPPFENPPKIDGKLDDPFWETGAILESFTQYEPLEGSEPTEKTVAYIGYDKNTLYIAVRCYDSNPKAVRACLTQRDKVMGDDEITIYLDTFNDKKRAFAFLVNPCGVQSDGIFVESGGGRRGRGGGGGFDHIDKNWDTYFTTDANMDDEGYTVEMAIPFKSLRFPHSQQQLWGMQIKRNIRRKNEEIYWYPRSRDINGFLIQAGTIQIDGSLNKGKNFEVMPVVTGLKEKESKFVPEAGLNLKYGITSDLTADATINPDFSQVEADMPQISVNQRYALYYPEKRPFFLEGKDYFDTPLELMYTRTIVEPGWGLKLTGKIGKTTIGVLSTYDFNASKIYLPGEDDEEDEEDEEDIVQKGFINVFRLKQDLFTESYIGLLFTDKELRESEGISISDYNRVGGVDGAFKFWNNYRFSFQVLGSETKVGEYKSSLVPAMKFDFNARGRHLSFSADYTYIPPDFEGSLGFFRRKDIKSFDSRLGYAFLPMTDLIVDIRPSLQYRRIYDFNNVLTDEEYELSFFMSGWRGTFISAGISRNFERYEGINFRRNNFRTWIRSEPLSWLSGGVNFSLGESIYYDENPYLGYKYSYGFNLTFKPLTNLRLFCDYRNDTFYKTKGGELEYEVNIFTQRIGYQITRHLSLRLITDYNDYDK
ncbi:MAG: DUF5916 domain-containing protein, partial [Candidatus Aminicenantaceae bacterium]